MLTNSAVFVRFGASMTPEILNGPTFRWRKIKKDGCNECIRLYSSQTWVAAPVKSVVESGWVFLVAHALCVKNS